MAQAVIAYLESHEVNISVSAKAAPWENGYQESFFSRLKDEMGYLDRFETWENLLKRFISKLVITIITGFIRH